ncbi:anti-sigma factor [Anaerobacillus alkalilacustris]|uniref:Anti-sigma factor n=1 Tax=Anaerobacillus alkalilacustris TaxID=393763 RepID=A0A1S2LRK1_9BACI|nr:zf-HC2 domain-containing protein [Anaerobacillus alkalilacustris]OIJ15138.1 anti-sigma factor [Anaerobacillus alkalilacustris]
MECRKDIVSLIHKYFDEEITETEKNQLKQHLNECNHCRNHFNKLKKSIAFVQSSSHIVAPPNFTDLVMKQLPQPKRSNNWKRWMKKNPFLAAASVFIILMSTSVFSFWLDSGDELSVSGQANLIIDKDRNVVVIPEGEIVEGDLIVRNGSLQIDGQVNGNVTIINGQNYRASVGKVTGNIEEIDEGLEWIWYNIKSFLSDAVNIFDGKKVNE